MTFHLRPGTQADIPTIASITLSAFTSNAIHARIIPSSPPPLAKLSLQFWETNLGEELSANDPNIHFMVVEHIDPNSNNSNPKVVGFAKWCLIQQGEQTGPTEGPPPGSFPGEDKVLAEEFFRVLGEEHWGIMNGRGHMYLELIATDPGYAGRGVGGMLVRWGCERADGLGVEAYLDATPVGKGLYERFGFVGVKEVGFLEGEYLQCFMVRSGGEWGGYREG